MCFCFSSRNLLWNKLGQLKLANELLTFFKFKNKKFNNIRKMFFKDLKLIKQVRISYLSKFQKITALICSFLIFLSVDSTQRLAS